MRPKATCPKCGRVFKSTSGLASHGGGNTCHAMSDSALPKAVKEVEAETEDKKRILNKLERMRQEFSITVKVGDAAILLDYINYGDAAAGKSSFTKSLKDQIIIALAK